MLFGGIAWTVPRFLGPRLRVDRDAWHAWSRSRSHSWPVGRRSILDSALSTPWVLCLSVPGLDLNRPAPPVLSTMSGAGPRGGAGLLLAIHSQWPQKLSPSSSSSSSRLGAPDRREPGGVSEAGVDGRCW